jgi:two-component system sensor histidine kinase HydH
MTFLWGLLAGFVGALLISAGAGVVAYRRILRLQERAKHAERLAELGTLTGGLAHEIKNPLSTVQLNLQLLKEDLSHDNPHFTRLSNRLKTCERETTRLRDILDDFLRYAGRIELEKRPTELNELCQELVDFYLPQAQLSRVQLRLRRSPQPLVANIDERLLKQAVLNLMLNGMQAMPQGGELILAVSSEDEQAIIDVIDTGWGIPAETIPKIFDAYYSTKKGGTGLGLAMTRRIAKEHGGDIIVTSDPGKGSIFSIRLPMK